MVFFPMRTSARRGGTTGHLELLGTNIVDFDDEALGVLVKEGKAMQ
jgi:hypothetical protein